MSNIQEKATADRHRFYQKVDKINSKDQAAVAKKAEEAQKAAAHQQEIGAIADRIDALSNEFGLDGRDAEFNEIFNSQPSSAELAEFGNRPKWLLNKLEKAKNRVEAPLGALETDNVSQDDVDGDEAAIEAGWQKRDQLEGGKAIEYHGNMDGQVPTRDGHNEKSGKRVHAAMRYLHQHGLSKDECIALAHRLEIGDDAGLGFELMSGKPTDEQVWQIMSRGKKTPYRDGQVQGIYLSAVQKLGALDPKMKARLVQALTERMVRTSRDMIVESAGEIKVIEAGTLLTVYVDFP